MVSVTSAPRQTVVGRFKRFVLAYLRNTNVHERPRMYTDVNERTLVHTRTWTNAHEFTRTYTRSYPNTDKRARTHTNVHELV